MLGQTHEDLAYWNKQMQKISLLNVFQEVKEKNIKYKQGTRVYQSTFLFLIPPPQLDFGT